MKIKEIPLKSLKNKLLIVKVGNDERPAGPKDIKDTKKVFKKALKGVKCRILVTHHALSVRVV
jgi:hypothetical protein